MCREGQARRFGGLAALMLASVVPAAYAQPVGNSGPAMGGYAAPQRPLARLVENPDASDGLPPFALTDQAGTIQRYVEPVEGLDLSRHVGQIVLVRHDTGRILLASQLELPPAPLMPLVGEQVNHSAPPPRTLATLQPRDASFAVTQAQFADDDDATVELLEEGQSPAVEQDGMPMMNPVEGGMPYSDGTYQMLPRQEIPPEMMGPNAMGPLVGPPCCGMEGCPEDMGYYPPEAYGAAGEYYSGPCPECGGYHEMQGQCAANNNRPFGGVYGDVEFNFFRPHITENSLGKLSERYELSPRFILGFRELGPFSARVRYWLYDRNTPILGGGSIRLSFDVYDIEATQLIELPHAQLVVAAGARFARIELGDLESDEAAADVRGLTFATDGCTALCNYRGGVVNGIYGGRVSILGGNWGRASNQDIILQPYRDDNIVVQELYGGFEYACCRNGVNWHARAAFEMQNWRSDVLSDRVDFGTISFIGPGIRVGAEF